MSRIAYPGNPLFAAFWYSALSVAMRDPEGLACYAAHRGHPFLLAGRRTGLDMLIDEATGADPAAVDDFVDWFNEWVWGEDPFKEPPE